MSEQDDGPTAMQPIDMLLQQGSAAERAELRERMSTDPTTMLEVADTVTFLESFRQLRTEASAELPAKLALLVRRAQRRLRPAPWPWKAPLLGLAAAALVCTLLWRLQPEAPTVQKTVQTPVVEKAVVTLPGGASILVSTQSAVASDLPDPDDLAWQQAVQLMRLRLGMQPTPQMSDAFEVGLDDPTDALSRWLEPRNALLLMRLDHQLRASSAIRQEVVRQHGGLPAVDDRVQQLADALATQMLAAGAESGAESIELPAMAMAVRALIAAGPGNSSVRTTRHAALTAASAWLAQRLPHTTSLELVAGLAAMVEVTAVVGTHSELVCTQSTRLLDLVLKPDTDTWARRLPDLLLPRISPLVLADASRVLHRVPGLGVDATRCRLVRQLLLGQLRERRANGDDSPELVSGMLFGSSDLLGESERDALERRLRRWKPSRLVPDFGTVHQMAWALAPGRRGFTRQQGELRQLAVCPDPLVLADRAKFCLCLATNYAAFGGDVLQRVAAGS